MQKKFLDDLVEDWRFDIDNLENIIVKIDGIEYRKEIYCDPNGVAYITHGGEKWYIGNVNGEEF